MDLTLFTVNYFFDDEINLNYRLTHALNPGVEFEWLIVDNTPGEELLPEFKRLPGVPKCEGQRSGSFQHASALGLLGEMKLPSRYLCIMDPDCYVVRKNWIRDVCKHMDEKGLALFGTPYDYKYIVKYRYFPCAFSLFIDLDKISLKGLNWDPIDEEPVFFSLWDRICYHLIKALGYHNRLSLGRNCDTGCRLYKKYRTHKHLYEAVKPNMLYSMEHIQQKTSTVDRFFPERFRYIPVKGSYEMKSFEEDGYKSFPGQYSDEYFWKGKPYAYHFRFAKNAQKLDEKERNREAMEYVESLIEAAG